jgi:hypothetical protein
MNRKPHPHNEPTVVTAHDEQCFLEKLQAEEESEAAALENWYAFEEWKWREGPFSVEARERRDKVMGVP